MLCLQTRAGPMPNNSFDNSLRHARVPRAEGHAARIEPHRTRPRLKQRRLRQSQFMKVILFGVLGLILGTLGGAALGIGLGIAWIEIFKTTDFEGYSGMLVFFTFMPAGAMIGGLGGAFLFGLLAFRDGEIAIEHEQAGPHD
jgi:hypothetical protein